MAEKVKDIDRGYKAFMEAIAELKKQPYVKVGVLGSQALEKYPEEASTVVEIATFNEFGTAGKQITQSSVFAGATPGATKGKGAIPERSYIRSTMDQKRATYQRLVELLAGEIYLKKKSIGQVLGLIAERIKGDIQRKIVTLKDPPNAPSTVAQKGSTNPLVDSGRLRQSIDYEVVEGGD